MPNENCFSAQTRVVSTTSKRIFDCISPSATVYLGCHSSVIYLITCGRYSPQYIREAAQRINERFN